MSVLPIEHMFLFKSKVLQHLGFREYKSLASHNIPSATLDKITRLILALDLTLQFMVQFIKLIPSYMKTKFFLPSFMAIILFLVPFFHATAAPELIKGEGLSAVYWVKDGIRHPFPQQAVYGSWFGTDFSLVKTLPIASLANYSLGKNIIFSRGSLIKIQTDPKVYEVLDEVGNISWIKTEADFTTRGFKFSDIKDVPDTFFSDYKISDTAAPVSPPTTPTAPTILPLTVSTSLSYTKEGATNYASLNVVANKPINLLIQTAPFGFSSSTIPVATTSTTQTVKLPAISGLHYLYSLVATDADGQTFQQTSDYYGYADLLVKTTNRVKINSPLLKADVLTGSFSISNNTLGAVSLNQLTLRFSSIVNLLNQLARNVSVYTLKNGVPDVLIGYKAYGYGDNFLGWMNLARVTVDTTLPAGSTQEFGVVLKNYENWTNTDYTNETFETYLAQINSGSEQTIIPEEAIGVLKISN